MDEKKTELFNGLELADDMLEGVNGGFELSEFQKSTLRDLISALKSDNMGLEQAVEYLSTKTAYGSFPDKLEVAVAYMRKVW